MMAPFFLYPRSLVNKLCGGRYHFNYRQFVHLLVLLLILPVFLSACKNNSSMQHITTHVFRLKPRRDLKEGIQKLVTEK